MQVNTTFALPYGRQEMLRHGGGDLFLGRLFLTLCATLGLLAVAAPLGAAVLVGLAFYAWRGPRESLEALSLLALLIMLNRGVAAVDVSMLRWLVLFSAFGRAIYDSVILDLSVSRFVRLLALFFVIVLVLSLLYSHLPVVSVFKLISFVAGVGTVFASFHRTPHLRGYWRAWFVTLGLFILVASLPLYFVSSVGYLRNGSGFQGILFHPQTYGPVCGSLAALFAGLVVFEGVRSRLLWVGMALALVGVYTSQSRTGLLAMFGGLAIVVGIGIFRPQTWQPQILRALGHPAALLLIALGLGVAVLKADAIKEQAMSFLLKDDATDGGGVAASLQSSRLVLINQSMANFRDAPLTGIGFGVPSDFRTNRVEVGFLGLPTSASVEKGFMPSAVLEETGLAGAVLVLMLLASLLAPVLRSGSVAMGWMLFTCLLVNGGEMVFYSVGGAGLFYWILMAFCHNDALREEGGPPRVASASPTEVACTS